MNIPGVFEPTAGEAATLALIRQHESGGQYNILCGGNHFLDYSAFPQWKGFKGSHAAGAYQIEPETWAWITMKTGVPDFSPIAQDINALLVAARVRAEQQRIVAGKRPLSLAASRIMADHEHARVRTDGGTYHYGGECIWCGAKPGAEPPCPKRPAPSRGHPPSIVDLDVSERLAEIRRAEGRSGADN